jgi:DNA-binding transcriptional MerR regulator
VNSPAQFLNPAEAARRLGVSAKALRLYEQRGLIVPIRTAVGWRTYGPREMTRAAEIAQLRALGLSLGQVAEVLGGEAQSLERALSLHQSTLEARVRELANMLEKVSRFRAELSSGRVAATKKLTRLLDPVSGIHVAFDLPWPWGGERFELRGVLPLTYIIGPLGSGKTRLAMRLAETLPNAAFVGLERLAEGGTAFQARLDADPALNRRVERTLVQLVRDGGVASQALVALLTGLEAEGPSILVIDMLEQGLDKSTQRAMIAYLRRRGTDARPLFFLTRSSTILDLDSVGRNEAIIFCPANHSPPTFVAPYPGAAGYEALASCLASPEVRARTDGFSNRPSQQA